jgi:hypothetical protein
VPRRETVDNAIPGIVRNNQAAPVSVFMIEEGGDTGNSNFFLLSAGNVEVHQFLIKED